jgi:hypothetical protein
MENINLNQLFDNKMNFKSTHIANRLKREYNLLIANYKNVADIYEKMPSFEAINDFENTLTTEKSLTINIHTKYDGNINKNDVNINKNDGNLTKSLITKNDGNLINIIYGEYYPFKPPYVYINGLSYYNTITRFPSDRFLNTFKLLTNHKYSCLCCQSIICNNNWNPTYTVISIMSEINKFMNIPYKIALFILINAIKNKYLFYNVNLIEYFDFDLL